MNNQTLKRLCMLLPAVALTSVTCTTQDGILATQGGRNATILVREINNIDARILLDRHPTGATTISGILESVPQGTHVVHLHAPNYRFSPDSILFTLEPEGCELVFEALPLSATGTLSLTSTPADAQVTVNGLVMGATPLLLAGINPGTYAVTISRGSATVHAETVQVAANVTTPVNATLQIHRQVLVEHFSNTACPGCPAISALIDELIESRHNNALFGIEYHPKEPSPDDPLYTAVPHDNDEVYTYYKPEFLPYFYISGLDPQWLGDPGSVVTQLDAAISAQLAVTPACAMRIQEVTWRSARVVVDQASQSHSNLQLLLALIQEEVDFGTAPGTNGQSLFKTVFRGYAAAESDSPVAIAAGAAFSRSFTFDRSPFGEGRFALIAILQDPASRSVLQTVRYSLD